MTDSRSRQLARLERPVRYALVLLALALVATSGCATHAHALDPTAAAVGADGLAPVGLKPTTSGGEVVLLVYAAVGVVIVGAFVIDLFLLPFAAHHHDMAFPCCQAVIGLCH